jgi:hypothetical protein
MGKKDGTRVARVVDAGHPLHGQRFVVQQWNNGAWYCWGQVTSFKNGHRRHEGSWRFQEAQVEVVEVADSGVALSMSLFEQCRQDLRRRGAMIYRNTIVKPPHSERFVKMARELGMALESLTTDDERTINEMLE